MELTQTTEKPIEQPEPKREENEHAKHASEVQGSNLSENQEDAAFVSASHEFAVKQFEAASGADDANALAKAEKVAHSMGYSQGYDKNPFDAETQKELAEAYEAGEKQQERMLEEARIGKDDKEMDYDN